jgi:hypothetical protein
MRTTIPFVRTAAPFAQTIIAFAQILRWFVQTPAPLALLPARKPQFAAF